MSQIESERAIVTPTARCTQRIRIDRVDVAEPVHSASMTTHAIPGIHTDAQLFEWITNGFPGSRMPAFKNTLSDTDRWNLVNFIRTLAPK